MAETKPPAGENYAERRRAQRVQIAMPVLVRGKSGGRAFEEKAQTVSVNAYGGMLRLAAQVVRDQQISIVNPKTAEELPSTVTSTGQKDGGTMEVGFEFSEPSPLFWRIAFPPEDWNPAERKRAGAKDKPVTPPRR